MLPKMINSNGKIYNTVGMIKLNNGAFLMVQNDGQLADFDFTQIPSLMNIPQFTVKKPTSVEVVFMDYIKSTIQDRLNGGQINDLTTAISEINRYVNTHKQLLTNMSQLDNKDSVVESQKENLLDYFAEEMSGLEYFQKKVIENIPAQYIEVKEEPIQQTMENATSSSLAQPISNTVPEYNEKTVDMILQQQVDMPNPSFNINGFVSQYFNQLTVSQMDILLSGKISINEQLQEMLKQRRSTMPVYNSLQEEAKQTENNQVVELSQPAKRKNFILKRERKNEAAFVDTLLLSFTVGTICGVYLMYFVLTIMS